MHTLRSAHYMKARAQTIFGNHLRQTFFAGELSTVSKETENRIIDDDRSCGAKCPAVAQIDLAGVPPRTATHLFIAKPCASPRSWLEASARAAVIVAARIPVSVVGLRRTRVQQRPG